MSIEAMKQALEALQANDVLINGSGTHGGLAFAMDGYYSGCFDIDGTNEKTEQAITALRQAIVEADQQEPVAWFTDDHREDKSATTYSKRMAERWKEKGWPVTPLYTAPVHASDISQERVDETAKDRHEFVKFRRGDILRCIETEELCTVWATSTSGKTLVTWGGNDFTEYTAEQIGELFWLEPESSDVEIAAEQSDNYASFLAGVRFARVTLFAPPTREWVGLTDEEIWDVFVKYDSLQYAAFARAIEQKIKEKNGATAPVPEQRG
jgi:hypothetical protein